jgi:hypothetical protein
MMAAQCTVVSQPAAVVRAASSGGAVDGACPPAGNDDSTDGSIPRPAASRSASAKQPAAAAVAPSLTGAAAAAGCGALAGAAGVVSIPACLPYAPPSLGGSVSSSSLSSRSSCDLSSSESGDESDGPASFVSALPRLTAAALRRLRGRAGRGPALALGRPDSTTSCASSAGSAGSAAGARAAAIAAAAAGAPAAAPGVVSFNWADKPRRALAGAALDTLVAAMAEDPVNAFLLGGAPSARFARKEIKGYLKALPAAGHFMCTPDAAAVALWQLLPHETPRNELLAGWTR